MREGFSFLELIVALLVLELGVLAVAGNILLAQRNMARAELTLRGVLEAAWIGDSLSVREGAGAGGSGSREFSWGSVEWDRADLGIGGLHLAAIRRRGEDTLAVLFLWPPLPDTLLFGPGGIQGGAPR